MKTRSFKDIMDIMLPQIVENGKIYGPGINEHHNGGQRSYGKHQGVDMNYHKETGERLGQQGINIHHPPVYSPVEGDILKPGMAGQIKIKDPAGYIHEINHLEPVAPYKTGDHIKEGDPIGNMGNTGCRDHHVDYKIYRELQNEAGKIIGKDQQDPEVFFGPSYEPAPGEEEYGEGYWPLPER